MKPFWLIALAVVLGVALGYGWTWAEFNIQHKPAFSAVVERANSAKSLGGKDPADGPVAFVLEETYHFGFMESNTESEHDFVIANKGAEPLKLWKIATSCRCTLSKLAGDQDKLEIAPGDETTITLSWHTKGKVGEFRQSADIGTNDPLHPQVKLVIEGNVTQTAIVSPSELVFSSLLNKEGAQGEVKVYSVREETFELKGARWDDATTANYFEVEMAPLEREKFDLEGVKYGWIVKVHVKPGLPLGPLNQKLKIDSTLTSLPEFSIPITGNVTGDINIAGRGWQPKFGALLIGIVNADKPVVRELQLIVRGDHRHEIEFEVEHVDPDFLQVEVGERADKGGNAVQVPLTITIPEGCQPCSHMGSEVDRAAEIMLKTNHPEVKQVRIRVLFAVAR